MTRPRRFERTISVESPLEEAFAYVADFSNLARWDPGVVESRRLDEAPVRVGSEFDVVARFLGRRIRFRFRIVELASGQRLVALTESASARSTDTVTFVPDGERTRITYRSDWRLTKRRLMEPLLAPLVAASGRRALRGLETQLHR